MSLVDYFVEGIVTGATVMGFVLLVKIIYKYVEEKI